MRSGDRPLKEEQEDTKIMLDLLYINSCIFDQTSFVVRDDGVLFIDGDLLSKIGPDLEKNGIHIDTSERCICRCG